jgi:BlaI family transcriptional regulator, penicillinase repressor
MPKDIADLSKNEWTIMNICWESGKATARQIYEEAAKSRQWEYQTVKTMLDRLVAKGYIAREKLGPLCLYKPAVTRTRTVARTIDTFWDTVLGKTFSPLFAHLAKGQKLSREEIASLRKVLEEHKEGDDNEER